MYEDNDQIEDQYADWLEENCQCPGHHTWESHCDCLSFDQWLENLNDYLIDNEQEEYYA